MDTVGRRFPISIGMFIAGIFMFLIPFFRTIYPGFFICRAMVSIGTILLVNSPLLPDYVQLESLGLANGITACIMAINNFFTGSVILQIAKELSD
jgi:MFS family permease